jgi:DegV family protein with EDD domain
MEYKIVVDSCTDLPKILKEDPAIKVVPLTLMVGDLVYMDNQEFDQKKFLQTMKASPSSPKSACPSPDDYLKEFNGGDNVFAVTISAELSGSYNSAELAKRLYLEENKKDIEVINSRSASVGQTLIVMKIKELISEGYSFRSIVEKVNAFRSDMKTKFVLESLDNLKKSGRLSNIQALVANVLNIKPIMGATPEGTITKIDQARGIKKALIAMAKTIERDVIRPKERILGIAHCNCLERAQFFKEEILKLVPFKDCFIVDTAGVSTMYANEGGIIVAY